MTVMRFARFRALASLSAASGALALGMLLPASSASAQEVVQQLPNPATQRLTEALRRLSRNPESLPALIDAGRASIELGDIEAAEGFFSRAQAVDRSNGSAMAGMAVVALRRQDAVTALDLFDRAQAAGEDLDPYAADHGLAYDLVGNNTRARQLYGIALARSDSSEVERRLALSHAISGDHDAFEAVLLPLLQRRDLAAYRTRAFGLAILGREDEAITIAETMLPARISRRLTPYLRYMPQLSPAQQAAAANLGRFPAVADIGRDGPQLARRANQPETPRPSGTSDARLIPGGAPLGSSSQAEAEPVQELPALARANPPAASVSAAPVTAAARPLSRSPRPGQPRPDAGSTPTPTSTGPMFDRPAAAEADTAAQVISSLEQATAAQRPATSSPQELLPAPSFSIADNGAGQPASLAAEVEEAEQVSLAEAFADFTLPPTGNARPAAPGAVDITTIDPVREVREPDPPPPPAHPSRHWVQVATGQDVSAFRFDWRRLSRGADGALDGFSPYRARWNQTNRLLTGPFDSAGEAQRFVTRLAEAGIDAFRFASAEGEEVIPLN